MKTRKRKIGIQISLLLIIAVMAGGTLVFLTAPNHKTSDDQLQLQQELQENAGLLAGQETIASVPFPISDDNTDWKVQEEDTVQFTAIGDSVMLGAAQILKERFPGSVISAAESRQVWEAESIISELDEKGELMDTVVIALGANGTFSEKQGQALLENLRQDCQIYWIAPYGKNLYWKDSTLDILHKLESENENLTILDWPAVAEQHNDWFYDDGMHLNESGQKGYAQFLMDNLLS